MNDYKNKKLCEGIVNRVMNYIKSKDDSYQGTEITDKIRMELYPYWCYWNNTHSLETIGSIDDFCRRFMHILLNRYGLIKSKYHLNRLTEDREYDEDNIEEVDPFQEYKDDYPTDSFDASNITALDLAEWCEKQGDFYYIYQGLRGWQIMVANTDVIASDIIYDLYRCSHIKPTHEMDYLLSRKKNLFENSYICVFKIFNTKDGDYYIVYQQDKN